VKLADLKATYPKAIARRMAEGLLKLGDGDMTVSDLLTRAEATPGVTPIGPMGGLDFGGGGVAAQAAPAKASAPAAAAAPAATAAAPAAVAEEDEGMGMEAYIESARCTSCNECTNLNPRLFSYNESKQAYVKDVRAGTFAQLVQAAERCPAGIIHPGDPVNPKEKDLAKWIKRAEPFN
jgi:ferredoxin